MVKHKKHINHTKSLSKADAKVTTQLSKETQESLSETLLLQHDPSPPFKAIKNFLTPLAKSMPLLLYNLPKVSSVISSNLALCPHSALAVVRALAREVRSELAPHFLPIFQAMLKALENLSAAEEVLQTLSLSLKYIASNLDVWKFMPHTYPLLSHSNYAIRDLAGQALAFLVRKAGPELLVKVLSEVPCWELAKHSASHSSAQEMLEASWAVWAVGRKAHLALALEKKEVQAVWRSVKSKQAFSVLREWAVLVNGHRIPPFVLKEAVDLCKEHQDCLTLAYLVKYHPDLIEEVNYILADIEAFKVLIDFQDPHPEAALHEELLGKSYSNHTHSFDFSPYSQQVYQLVEAHLETSSLEVVIWLFKTHTFTQGNIQFLDSFIATLEDPNSLWVALRVARLCRIPVNTQNISTANSIVAKELLGITENMEETDIRDQTLWTAAELDIPLTDLTRVESYLTDPLLRVPATKLLSKYSSAMQTAFEVCKDPADLDNEKLKINLIKRLEHTEDYSRVSKFLIGMFWERFSTLWKHLTSVLKTICEKDSEVVWEPLYFLLQNPPSEPCLEASYAKFADLREHTPVDTFYLNLLECTGELASALKEHKQEFVNLFLEFIENEYTQHCWIPGYQVPVAKSSEPVLKKKLKLLLNALKSFKGLRKLNSQKLTEVLVCLCSSKKEEIRVLAVDALLKLKETKDANLLKLLAKDSSFKEAILSAPIESFEAVTALCAARAFSKRRNSKAALHYVSLLPLPSYILDFLPVKLSSEGELQKYPVVFCLNFLKNLNKLVVHCPKALSCEAVVSFCLSAAESLSNRELLSKTVLILKNLADKFNWKTQHKERLLTLMIPALKTFSHDIRPKFIDLHFSVLNNFSELRTNIDLLQATLDLAKNPKVSSAYLSRCLETLVLQVTSETLQSYLKDISQSAYSAFQKLGPTNSLLKVLEMLPPSEHLTSLINLLLKPSLKNPQLRALIQLWLPEASPPPKAALTQLLLKHSEVLPLAGACMPELKPFSASVRRGLKEEDCYDTQLEALNNSHTAKEHPQAQVYAVGHFLLKEDIGLKVAATSALKSLGVQFPEYTHKILGVVIKNASQEEQIRAIMQVWNEIPSGIQHLASQDPDLSVLLNLAHLQVHRRQRAFTSLKESQVQPEFIKELIVPLMNFYILFSSHKKNYSENFMHHCITLLADKAWQMSWREYSKLLKLYLRHLEDSEKTATKALAMVLQNLPPNLQDTQLAFLKGKVFPVLKDHIIAESSRTNKVIRKFVVLGLYSIVSVQPKQEQETETHRLLTLLSKKFSGRDQGMRDSVVKSAVELLRYGMHSASILKEFNKALDSELFTLFLTKVLPSGVLQLNAHWCEKCIKALLEYEQYSTFYSIARTIKPELFRFMLASTKPLQHITQGLCENPNITSEDLISIGLALLSSKAPSEAPKTAPETLALKKFSTFGIQEGASTGRRPASKILKKSRSPEKVFGVRLVKQGLLRCKDGVDPEVAHKCQQAALENLSSSTDEVLAGVLDILKLIPSPDFIEPILKVSDKAGQDITIHAFKTLATLLRTCSDIEEYSSSLLPQVCFGLQNPVVQSSALKLLRIFVYKNLMDPLVYDCMEILPRLLITSPFLVSQISNLYSEFLMAYPLSEKRKQYHLDFLIKQIEVNDLKSRGAILNSLKLLLDKLPFEELKEHFDFMMLSLLTAISNEEDEDFKQPYYELLRKASLKNPVSPLFKQISTWCNHSNINLRKASIGFMGICVKENLLQTKLFKKEVLPKILDSAGEIPVDVLQFLSVWNSLYKDTKVSKTFLEIVDKFIEQGKEVEPEIIASLEECPVELLRKSLPAIENNTFTRGIKELMQKADPRLVSKYSSRLTRKLLGRGIEDNRTFQLIEALTDTINKPGWEETHVFKALIIISEISKSEATKDLANLLFQKLHSTMSQEEFLKKYSETRTQIHSLRQERKANSKILAVKNPQVFAQIKQKRRLRQKLAYKKRKLN